MIFRIYDSKRMDMYIQTIRQNQLARFRNVSWNVYIIYLFIPCRCMILVTNVPWCFVRGWVGVIIQWLKARLHWLQCVGIEVSIVLLETCSKPSIYYSHTQSIFSYYSNIYCMTNRHSNHTKYREKCILQFHCSDQMKTIHMHEYKTQSRIISLSNIFVPAVL